MMERKNTVIMKNLNSQYNKPLIFILCATAVIFFYSAVSSYSKSDVKWHDFNSGAKAAKREKKHIIIDMYAPWCGWCKVMDRETFENSKVADLLKKDFIAVRVDMDSKDKIKYKGYNLSSSEFSSLFGVQGLPTVVFLDMNGEFIDKVPGFTKADLFTKILEYIRDECYKKKIKFKDYAEGRVDCK